MDLIPVTLPKCELSRVGLAIAEGTNIQEWAAIGRSLCAMRESSLWWVGDWLNHGESRYGDKKEALAFFGKEVLGSSGYEYGTLRQAAYVSSSIKLSSRIDNLSWSHHQIVAPMEEKEQRKWLKKASEAGWTVKEFKSQIKAALAGNSTGAQSQELAFNPLAWVMDGVRGFQLQLSNAPLDSWETDRLLAVSRDFDRLAPIKIAIDDELARRTTPVLEAA